MVKPSEPKWRKFEQIVTAIHRTEEKGALVKWNDNIQGRQFDVTLRFSHGLYDYLVVIECKDYAGNVPMEKVDAFVTKSKYVRANKAVMVAASGFQSGCMEIAGHHGIELFTLKEVDYFPDNFLSENIQPVLVITDVVLKDLENKLALENDPNKLPYLMRNTFIILHNDRKPLSDFIDAALENSISIGTERRKIEFALPSSSFVQLPNEEKTHIFNRVTFYAQIVSLSVTKFPGLDPTIYSKHYEYSNALTGEAKNFNPANLDLGAETRFEAGKFYKAIGLLFSYYCESIVENLANLYLVESYQYGILFQAEFIQETKLQTNYLEITDPEEIKRLHKFLTPLID